MPDKNTWHEIAVVVRYHPDAIQPHSGERCSPTDEDAMVWEIDRLVGVSMGSIGGGQVEVRRAPEVTATRATLEQMQADRDHWRGRVRPEPHDIERMGITVAHCVAWMLAHGWTHMGQAKRYMLAPNEPMHTLPIQSNVVALSFGVAENRKMGHWELLDAIAASRGEPLVCEDLSADSSSCTRSSDKPRCLGCPSDRLARVRVDEPEPAAALPWPIIPGHYWVRDGAREDEMARVILSGDLVLYEISGHHPATAATWPNVVWGARILEPSETGDLAALMASGRTIKARHVSARLLFDHERGWLLAFERARGNEVLERVSDEFAKAWFAEFGLDELGRDAIHALCDKYGVKEDSNG